MSGDYLVKRVSVNRVTKLLKLPNVTAYILTGVLLGPFCFNVIPTEIINSLGFVTDVALGFIAFGVGRYFLFHELKRNGINILILTCCEALIAAVVIIFVMVVIFRQPLAFALLLGAIGSATAPGFHNHDDPAVSGQGRFRQFNPAGRRFGRCGIDSCLQRLRGDRGSAGSALGDESDGVYRAGLNQRFSGGDGHRLRSDHA